MQIHSTMNRRRCGGRPRKIGKRHACGQLVHKPKVMMTPEMYAMRVSMVGAEHAMNPLAGSVLGRLLLMGDIQQHHYDCLLYTSPSPRDRLLSRMPSSA